jgi:hypothetical protein
MARSRRIYAAKLLRAYPDEPREVKYYTTRVIAPRFLLQMLAEYHRALVFGTPEEVLLAHQDLRFIVPYVHRRSRYAIMALLPLFRYRPLARLLLVTAGLLRNLLPTASRRALGMTE